MPIRRLPPLLVNQIAAGEVIERPASVIKELVENAIDAGARRIEIEVEGGGKTTLRVTDDGSGMPEEELPLAVAAHATSKIAEAEDLDAIATMGFRGEALASIAAVSRLSIVTRTREADAASRLDAEGDRIDAPRPAAGPPGTTITVRNLFFNTPARRKFLKTDSTENNRIVEAARTLALPLPAVAFTVITDGRTRLDLAATTTPRDRVLAVIGKELEPELLEVREEIAGMRLHGLVGRPSIARGTTRHLRLYLNGRAINDRAVVHAVREAYRGLIEPGATPTAVLFLEMDPATVDVNVHPAKAEVRFRDQGAVHRIVRRAVARALEAADLVPALALDRGRPGPGLDFGSAFGSGPSFGGGQGFGSGESASMRSGSMLAGGHVGHVGHGGSGRAPILDAVERLAPQEKGIVYRELKAALSREAPEELGSSTGTRADAEPGASAAGASEPVAPVRAATGALQVHRSYIVAEEEDGLVIVDQHALHERIMFERLLERVDAGPLEAQRLLMPAVVEADERQLEALESLGPLFERLGIEAEPIGPTAIAVHSYPSLLFERNVDPVDFIEETLTRSADGTLGDGLEGALHEVLDMMACKAAIKAGDALEPAAIADLLAQRARVERSSRCPHGRPTTLRLTLADLERQFGRR